jgi:hypothetical protein
MNELQLTASGTIPGYSCVKLVGSDQVGVTTSSSDVVFGVTTFSQKANGEIVQLQSDENSTRLLRAGGTIAAGDFLVPASNGAVVKSSDGGGQFIATEAATSGQNVWALLSNSKSSSTQINYLATGSSTPKEVSSKLAEQVSVKDFGAIGNGIADDTAAIQAALNSGARTIFMPDGTYKVSSTIYIPGSATGASASLVGNGPNTIIDAQSISGAVIRNYQGTFTNFYIGQFLKNLRIKGSATHGVLWTGGVQGGIEGVRLNGLSATNGFVFDGSFANVIRDVSTQGATISNACFWFARDFNANQVDSAYTSNFCTVNFLWSTQSIASTGSPYDGSGGGYGTIGSCFSNITIQGGNTGLAMYNVNLGGATVNTVYCENVLLPVQFGNFSTSELCRSVTINNLCLTGYAQAGHPGGSSTRAVDFDNALNVTLTSPDFGPFGNATVPTIIRYREAFKCSIINYYHTTGGYGSSLTTGQIKRHTSATSDAGIFVQGQESDPGSGARSHFLFMRCNDYGYKHFKMALTTTGTWVATAVTPSVL